jgi:hypothetical protein
MLTKFSRQNIEYALLFIILICLDMGCKSTQEEPQPEPGVTVTRDINDVMKDHTAEWMALPGVVGVYIGARDDSTLCIRVMVVAKTPELEQQIPSALEGHPVEIEETGLIRPMPKDSAQTQ